MKRLPIMLSSLALAFGLSSTATATQINISQQLAVTPVTQAATANIELAANITSNTRRNFRRGSSSRKRFNGTSIRRFPTGNGFRNWTSNRNYNAKRRGMLRKRISRHRRHI